jgi:hypothetical protein
MLRNAIDRARGRLNERSWSLNAYGAPAASIRATTSVGSRLIRVLETPAAETKASLGGDEAAHRVTDDRAVAHLDRVAEFAQQAAVVWDRDVPVGLG